MPRADPLDVASRQPPHQSSQWHWRDASHRRCLVREGPANVALHPDVVFDRITVEIESNQYMFILTSNRLVAEIDHRNFQTREVIYYTLLFNEFNIIF